MIATVVVFYILKLAGFIKFPDCSLSTFHKVSWLKKKQWKALNNERQNSEKMLHKFI